MHIILYYTVAIAPNFCGLKILWFSWIILGSWKFYSQKLSQNTWLANEEVSVLGTNSS